MNPKRVARFKNHIGFHSISVTIKTFRGHLVLK